MWVEELSLENIKCLAKQTIRFGTEKSFYPWVTLLGENGTGKSTILQALSLMLAGPEGASQLIKPESWLQDISKPGKMTIRLHQGENDPGQYGGDKKERKVFQYTFYVTGPERLTINNKVYTEPVIAADTNSKVIPWLRENALLPKGKGWFGAGYGAFRRLTRENRILVPSLQTPFRYTNFSTQFQENQALEAFETWMVFLDYKISKANGDDKLAEKQHSWGIEAINSLLPEGNRFDGIDTNGRIWFQTPGGKVSTLVLSDGFRSILALAGDLVWRLIEAFPDSNNPLEEQGVVIIDELDIHLHPTWQRTIASLLRKNFPNIQFIMATHSPLVAAGAGSDAVTYRFNRVEGHIHIEQIKDLATLNVDDILKSPAFGLISTYSPETQQRIDDYFALKNKPKRTKEEEDKLQLSLPFVEKALGFGVGKSETETMLDTYIQEHWK